MRFLPPAMLVVALAGCGKGSAFDEAFRNSYREKGVQTCASEARAQIARSGQTLMAGVDFDRICGCAVDRIMAGKSASELMREPDAREQQAAIEQCVAQAGPGAGGKP